MKIKTLLFGILAFTAIAVNAKDTTYVSRQVLSNNIKNIIFEELCTVEVSQGDSNCIFFYTTKKPSKQQQAICQIDGDSLRIKSVDNGIVKLVLMDNVNILTLKVKANVSVNGNFIMANPNSKISLESFSNINFNALKAENLTLNLDVFSNFAANSADIKTLVLNTKTGASVTIPNGNIDSLNTDGIIGEVNAKISTNKMSLNSEMSSEVENWSKISTNLVDALVNKAKERKKKGHWDTEFTFAFGGQNWSHSYFASNAVNGKYSLDYGTAYILELKGQYVFPCKWFSIELGMGYESDVLNFNQNVTYIPVGQSAYLRDINLEEIEGTLISNKTKMVARYVTVPMMLNFKIGKIHTGIGAVAGINYNNSHTGVKMEQVIEYPNDKKVENYSRLNYTDFNPYKLDFRATLGFDGIRLFFQSSMLSMIDESIENLYPYKIGMYITL